MNFSRVAHSFLIIILCTLVLSGCSRSGAEPQEDSAEQQRQSTDESEVTGGSQLEAVFALPASQAPDSAPEPSPEPTPEPLYYTLDGEEYEVILNMTDFNVYSDLKSLAEDSDLVVIGHFTEDAVEKSNAHTNAFEITQVLKGTAESDVIRIYQRYTVSRGNKRIVAYSHLTPMEKDSEWICFLKCSNPEEMLYYHTGDTMGRYPFQEIDPDKWNNGEYSSKEIGVYQAEDFRYDIFSELLKEYGIQFE